MALISNGKSTIARLASSWEEIIAAQGPTTEILYRIEKLILRLDVIADKIFIKTVKAQNILAECEQLTEQFKSEITKYSHKTFLLLSRLESRMEDLVKKTHEFRIKAG